MSTAAILLIGDELLSGRTQDLNLKYIAENLQNAGIVLQECRVVSDKIEAIVEAVNSLRIKHNYLFTTGGIGGTHDDITYESVAKALNLPLEIHQEGLQMLAEIYQERLNDARSRMALVPKGAVVRKKLSYQIENIYMLAGIPKVMREMFDEILPTLQHGKPIHSITIKAYIWENDIADELRSLQSEWPQISIGSYPFNEADCWGTNIVARSSDTDELIKIKPLLEKLCANKAQLSF
jgi:molybdenum cofactor synthesis domain-containing protein